MIPLPWSDTRPILDTDALFGQMSQPVGPMSLPMPLWSDMTGMALNPWNDLDGRRRGFRRAILAVAVALLSAMAGPSHAETTAKDILVAVRTLGFVVHPPTGTVALAIVVDPALAQSTTDLQTVNTVLDGGIPIGAMVVRPVAIAVTELDRLADFRFVLVMGGVQSYRQAIFDRTRGRGIVTISTDFDCVRAGLCVLGVAAEPRVQVLVSRAACMAAAVEFLVAFRMMISEM